MAVGRFAVGFVNGYNLYPLPGRLIRNPYDFMSDADKVRGLAAGLVRAAGAAGRPDLIGLAEVGDVAMAHDVFAAIDPGRYSPVWQGPPPLGPRSKPPLTNPPGLMLGYDPDVFAVEEEVPGEATVGEPGRFHWLAVRLRLRRASLTSRPFWAVVVHWPSDYRAGTLRGTWPRVQVGRALGEFCDKRATATAEGMLILGFQLRAGRPTTVR